MITKGNGGTMFNDRPIGIETSPSVAPGKDYDGIIKGLKTIKEKYDASLKEKALASGSSEAGKTFDTDEDLLARATSELESKYAPKRSQAEARYGDTLTDAEKKKTSFESAFADAVRKIRATEERRLAAQSESFSRRGVTHSSIARLQKEKTMAETERELQITDAYYAEKVDALEEKIRRAQRTYDDAMRGYEISYAIELEKKMTKYRAERDKLLAAYEKSTAKTNEKTVSDYLKKEEALNAAFEAANGDYVGEKRDNYLERYAYVVKEMKDMSDAERKGFLKTYETSLREYLGLYYDKLLGK